MIASVSISPIGEMLMKLIAVPCSFGASEPIVNALLRGWPMWKWIG